MLVAPVRAHLWREPKDSIGALIKTFAFGQAQKLEVKALLVLLHARSILGLLALEFGRAVDD